MTTKEITTEISNPSKPLLKRVIVLTLKTAQPAIYRLNKERIVIGSVWWRRTNQRTNDCALRDGVPTSLIKKSAAPSPSMSPLMMVSDAIVATWS